MRGLNPVCGQLSFRSLDRDVPNPLNGMGIQKGRLVKWMVIPTVQFVVLYLLKVLFGCQSMNELPRVLFSHVGLMELVGFNARQVEEGLTRQCPAQKQEETGTTLATVSGRQY